MRGKYLPDEPNNFFIDKMQQITKDLNQKENVSLPNPYNLARPILNSMVSKNRGLNLKTDEMKVPFAPMQTSPFGVEAEPKNILPANVNISNNPVLNANTYGSQSTNGQNSQYAGIQTNIPQNKLNEYDNLFGKII
jgi:hypothetical protein